MFFMGNDKLMIVVDCDKLFDLKFVDDSVVGWVVVVGQGQVVCVVCKKDVVVQQFNVDLVCICEIKENEEVECLGCNKLEVEWC